MPDTHHHAVDSFRSIYDLQVPVLLAPMAGACPPALSAGVINAGGFGACGALLMQPAEITAWATEVRAASSDRFQINLWIPDPPPQRNPIAEAATRRFLEQWGAPVPPQAGDARPPDFDEQCETLIGLRPRVMSSIMGLYPPAVVDRMKSHGIHWFATATTVAEAVAAEEAGADVVVAQGMEAGGHRGAFDNTTATENLVGLFSLVPAIVDSVRVPVVATGGIGDGRGVAAAILLGASAVQIGTAFLRTPEANIAPAWADAISRSRPEDTTLTRAFSGRTGRSITTAYTLAAAQPETPAPAAYPVQRGLTQAMRDLGVRKNDIDRIQGWAGQSAALAQAIPCAQIVGHLWNDAQQLLSGNTARSASR